MLPFLDALDGPVILVDVVLVHLGKCHPFHHLTDGRIVHQNDRVLILFRHVICQNGVVDDLLYRVRGEDRHHGVAMAIASGD